MIIDLGLLCSYTTVRVVMRKSLYTWRARGAAAWVHARISARHKAIFS
jgi:hypothetical protein